MAWPIGGESAWKNYHNKEDNIKKGEIIKSDLETIFNI